MLILCAVVISAVIFFVPKNKKASPVNADFSLEVSAQDLNIKKGERREGFYTVSQENASISFDIENENLVKIENRTLIALAEGKTNLTITARLQGNAHEVTISITISDEKTVTISPLENCRVQEGRIFADQNVFAFDINIFDCQGQPISYPYECRTPEGVTMKRDVQGLIFKASQSFTLTIILGSQEISFDVVV